MIFRALAFLVSLLGITLLAAMILAEPDFPSIVAGKLAEGGMWTGLAAFLVFAVVLGIWPRDAEGRLRTLAPRRR